MIEGASISPAHSFRAVDPLRPRPAAPPDPAPSEKPAGSQAQEIQLSAEDRALVEKLKVRDREVRAHEQAHQNAGGQHAGGASYHYETGPDGKRYAVGGEVVIDIAPVDGDPDATITKMDKVIAAALAPAEPSAQDRRVAARARAERDRALAALAQENPAQENPALQQRGAPAAGNVSSEITRIISAYQASQDLPTSGSPRGRTFDAVG